MKKPKNKYKLKIIASNKIVMYIKFIFIVCIITNEKIK